eukprot:4906332-Lingulodinium_polyedra.AAC.1
MPNRGGPTTTRSPPVFRLSCFEDKTRPASFVQTNTQDHSTDVNPEQAHQKNLPKLSVENIRGLTPPVKGALVWHETQTQRIRAIM